MGTITLRAGKLFTRRWTFCHFYHSTSLQSSCLLLCCCRYVTATPTWQSPSAGWAKPVEGSAYSGHHICLFLESQYSEFQSDFLYIYKDTFISSIFLADPWRTSSNLGIASYPISLRPPLMPPTGKTNLTSQMGRMAGRATTDFWHAGNSLVNVECNWPLRQQIAFSSSISYKNRWHEVIYLSLSINHKNRWHAVIYLEVSVQSPVVAGEAVTSQVWAESPKDLGLGSGGVFCTCSSRKYLTNLT